MEFDDYLSKLGTDIDNQLSRAAGGLGFDAPESPVYDEPQDNGGCVYCPECGTRLPAGSKFCSNCGTRIDAEDSGEDGNALEVSGIIMTDTDILAEKYCIDRDEVVDAISDFMSGSADLGNTWMLLDMADYQENLGEALWMDYSDVLQDFLDTNNIKQGPSLSLFIIGGNDVIPQPAETNPCGDPEDEYQATVYADFYYCFHGQLPLDYLDFNSARCNVGRLPLEMGEMTESTFEEDIVGYLNRALSVMEEGGITITKAVMTSNSDWIPASREMSRNLPIEHLDNEEGEVLDNMYLSPDVLCESDNDDLMEQYHESLHDSNMLVFNLHGACSPDMSGFYSSDLAFSIGSMDYTDCNPKIFNTVACWGARYINYNREDSMLLNAIYYNNFMLYSGSCVPALGKCGNFECDSTWMIQPAAYSETFMARYCEYLCVGTMTAGEAFLKAKCDYYNTSRKIEDDESILGTVLMFNLYGNPLIQTHANVEPIQSESGAKNIYRKEMRMPYSPVMKKTVLKSKNTDNNSKSLLDDIRGSVDAGLRAIHDIVTKNLYEQLNLEPRELTSVQKFTVSGVKGPASSGYLYNYKKNFKSFSSDIHVKVDGEGRILDAIQTK